MPKIAFAIFFAMAAYVAFIDYKKIYPDGNIYTNPEVAIKEFKLIESNIDDCRKYVKENSGAPIQIEIGELLCVLKFGNAVFSPTPDSTHLSQCIMKSFGEIVEEGNRNQIIAKCNLDVKDKNLGYLIIEEYSHAKRIENMLAKDKRDSARAYRNILSIASREHPDGPVLLNIDGALRSCLKIGDSIDCD